MPFTAHWKDGEDPPLLVDEINEIVFPAHITGFPIIEMDGVTKLETVMVIAFDVAGLPTAIGSFEVILHVTVELLAKVVVVKVALFVPAFTPFTCHWYVGVVPPNVGTAVNVTLSPEQMVLFASLEVMETDAALADCNR